MQKSASPASVALRLNNLEQKFDELEAPEPSEPDRTILDKLAKLTVFGAEAPGALNPDWSKNTYWFENISLSQSLYGLGQISRVYPAVIETPFYNRVFGNSDQFGRPSSNAAGASMSFAYSIYGGYSDFDKYFSEVSDGRSSLCHRIFGSTASVDWLNNGTSASWGGSLFDRIFSNTTKDMFVEYNRDTVMGVIEALSEQISEKITDFGDELEANDLYIRDIARLVKNIENYLGI